MGEGEFLSEELKEFVKKLKSCTGWHRADWLRRSRPDEEALSGANVGRNQERDKSNQGGVPREHFQGSGVQGSTGGTSLCVEQTRKDINLRVKNYLEGFQKIVSTF